MGLRGLPTTRTLRAGLCGALLLALAGCLPWGGEGAGAPLSALPDAAGAGVAGEGASPAGAADGASTEGTSAAANDLEITGPETTGPLAEAPEPERPDPERAACERTGGRMVAGPGGFGRLCVQPTPDAGKACRASGDCSGHCLARGNVCAPLTPLLGCHDILLAGGERVTQCIE